MNWRVVATGGGADHRVPGAAEGVPGALTMTSVPLDFPGRTSSCRPRSER